MDEYQPLSREEVILYVGRLSSNKGIQAIVEAFKDSGLNSLGKRLLIAGRGELEDFVRGAALSIPGVEYLGEVSEENKINLMRRSRCFYFLK